VFRIKSHLKQKVKSPEKQKSFEAKVIRGKSPEKRQKSLKAKLNRSKSHKKHKPLGPKLLEAKVI